MAVIISEDFNQIQIPENKIVRLRFAFTDLYCEIMCPVMSDRSHFKAANQLGSVFGSIKKPDCHSYNLTSLPSGLPYSVVLTADWYMSGTIFKLWC